MSTKDRKAWVGRIAAPYLHLIANEVAASANQLAEKIAASFQPTKETGDKEGRV